MLTGLSESGARPSHIFTLSLVYHHLEFVQNVSASVALGKRSRLGNRKSTPPPYSAVGGPALALGIGPVLLPTESYIFQVLFSRSRSNTTVFLLFLKKQWILAYLKNWFVFLILIGRKSLHILGIHLPLMIVCCKYLLLHGFSIHGDVSCSGFCWRVPNTSPSWRPQRKRPFFLPVQFPSFPLRLWLQSAPDVGKRKTEVTNLSCDLNCGTGSPHFLSFLPLRYVSVPSLLSQRGTCGL